MRKSTFASLAALAFSVSLALTGCQVGDEGDGGGGGGDPKPDAGGGGGSADAGGGQAQPCPPSVEDFKTDVYDVALTACQGCHANVAGFKLSANDQSANRDAATAAATKQIGGVPALLKKPTSAPPAHGGGAVLQAGSTQYKALEKFVGQVTGAACP